MLNDTTGIFIARETLNAFSPDLRTKLLQELFNSTPRALPVANPVEKATDPSAEPAEDDDYDPHFLELSPGQARDFLTACHGKTRTTIEVMVQGDNPQFRIGDIAAKVGVKPHELRGVWSGLTRRSRTVSGDDDAYLIWWSGKPEHDEAGNYINQTGELTELTYRSFRKALNLA